MEKSLAAQIAEEFDIDERLANLMVERGVTNLELASLTFNPNYEDITIPETIPNMRQALERLLSAIGKKEPILVWGHEDADGSTSVSVMLKTIKLLGGVVDYFIPAKSKEGHGLHFGRLQEIKKRGFSLVVTVDSGTSTYDEAVRAQRELGIDVIITDHHEIPPYINYEDGEVPLVNPKLPESGSFKYLAGVGVAFKIAWGLSRYKLGWSHLDIEREAPELLVYALIGTIADRVPLWNENKALVDKGKEVFDRISLPFIRAYERINKTRPAIENLISIVSAGKSKDWINTGVELLMTEDDVEAEEIIKNLMAEMEAWTKTAEELLERALSEIKRVRKYILIDMGDVPPQYLGYLSSRLKDAYKVPTIVLGRKEDGTVVAEVRAPHGHNSLDLLNSVSHLFIDYGGHKLASGFSMEESAIPELAEEVEFYYKTHSNAESEGISADIVITENPLKEQKLLQDVERLGKVGFIVKVLFENIPIGAIREAMTGRLINDPEGLLDLYSDQTVVRLLISGTPDGLVPEFIEPVEEKI